MVYKIRYTLLLIAVCAANSHSIFAAAEANPAQRDLASEYLEEGPVGITDLVKIFKQYTLPTLESEGLLWEIDSAFDEAYLKPQYDLKRYRRSLDRKKIRTVSLLTLSISAHMENVITLEPGDTWRSFKEKIEESLGIPVARQKLFSGGTVPRGLITIKDLVDFLNHNTWDLYPAIYVLEEIGGEASEV
jgi:hypothetical protein